MMHSRPVSSGAGTCARGKRSNAVGDSSQVRCYIRPQSPSTSRYASLSPFVFTSSLLDVEALLQYPHLTSMPLAFLVKLEFEHPVGAGDVVLLERFVLKDS